MRRQFMQNYRAKPEVKLHYKNINNERGTKVIKLTPEWEFVAEYPTIAEALKSTNLKTPQSITQVCRGRNPLGGGYRWMFKKDYETKFNNEGTAKV